MALELKMTVGQLEKYMNSKEFSEWVAYFKVEDDIKKEEEERRKVEEERKKIKALEAKITQSFSTWNKKEKWTQKHDKGR